MQQNKMLHARELNIHVYQFIRGSSFEVFFINILYSVWIVEA